MTEDSNTVHTQSMSMAPIRRVARAALRVDAPDGDVFTATIDTIRSLPGWEVLQARADERRIHVRRRGRVFSPTVDHVFHIMPDGPSACRMSIESERTRTHVPHDDPHDMVLFQDTLRASLRQRLDAHPNDAVRAEETRAPRSTHMTPSPTPPIGDDG